MPLSSFQQKQRPIGFAGLVALFVFIILGKPAHPSSVEPPRQMWFSLGFSTLGHSPVDWEFVRQAVQDPSFLRRLGTSKTRKTSLVIPVFDNGQAFFDTKVAPFSGRNASAAQDEAALRRLILAAKKRGIQIFLAVNALSWDYPRREGWANVSVPSIFDSAPELEETDLSLAPPRMGPRFASPWSQVVQTADEKLVTEVAAKFPDADGLVLDVHLNRAELSGFGSAARLKSIREVGVDPVALSIEGTADEHFSPQQSRFVAWRDASLTEFQNHLINAWLGAQQTGKAVWLSGAADYGAVAGFDALRSGQNWPNWMMNPKVSGVLLEGRWSEGDAPRWLSITRGPKPIVPISVPAINGWTVAKDWNLISLRGTESSFGGVADSKAALEHLEKFSAGTLKVTGLEPSYQIGTIAPDLEFYDANGKLWTSRQERGKKALFILREGLSSQAHKNWHRDVECLEHFAPDLALQGIQAVAVCRNALTSNDFPLLSLRDTSDGLAPAETQVLLVDRAGWVRAVQRNVNAKAIEGLVVTHDPTPLFRVGALAPDFTILDMFGQTRSIAALRGKKALVLSFFPKCFTGGCANHMDSLNRRFEEFQSNDIEILGVSIDAADVQRDFADRWKLRFPLVPDPGHQLCFLYDAVPDIDSLAVRQTVFIDKAGIVRFVDRDVHVTTHGSDLVEHLRSNGLI